MLIIISIAILLGGFFFNSDKKYSVIMLIYMWLLFAFNAMNADYIAYTKIYDHIVKGNIKVISIYEEGYVFLCKLGGNLGMTYQQFMIMVSTIATMLFAVVIKLYSSNRFQNINISLFIIFSYWTMICQYRTYLAILLVLLGLYFLYTYNDRRGIVLFVLFVFLGGLFHRMAFLYILFLPARRWGTKAILFCAIPLTILIPILIRSSAVTDIIAHYVPAYKLSRWILMDDAVARSWLGYIATGVPRVGVPILEMYIFNREGRTEANKEYLEKQKFIVNISIMSLVYVPFELMIKDYERLSRVSLFYFFIFATSYLQEHRVNCRRVPIKAIIIASFLTLYFILFSFSHVAWFSSNLVPILTQNSILGL